MVWITAAEHQTSQVATKDRAIKDTINPSDPTRTEVATPALTPIKDNTTHQLTLTRWVASEQLDLMAAVINVARKHPGDKFLT